MTKEKLVAQILGEIMPKEAGEPKTMRDSEPVSFWLTLTAKAKYARLQKQTKKQFGKRLRAHLEELILAADELVTVSE